MEENTFTTDGSWRQWFKQGVDLIKEQINTSSSPSIFIKCFISGMTISSVVGMAVRPKYFTPPFDSPIEPHTYGWIIAVIIVAATLGLIYLLHCTKVDKWQRFNKTVAGGAGMSIGLAGGLYILIPLICALIIIASLVGFHKIATLTSPSKNQPFEKHQQNGNQ